MCIIFDLDDTLIDTSSLIPHKLELIARRLHEEGIVDPHARLVELDRSLGCTRDALSALLKERGVAELSQAVQQILKTPPPQELSITPLPGALELLRDLSRLFTLGLVTKGEPALQLEKLKRAGLDRSLFRRMVILETGSKKKAYTALMDELGLSPSMVTVCGDRPEIDLRPAKELGCTTIHVKWGRGRMLESSPSIVDHVVQNLSEIRNLVSHA